MRRRKLLARATAIAAAAGIVRIADANGAGLPAAGKVVPATQRPMAPDISGATLTGGHLDTRGRRGQGIVVNFWGSWCVPCREVAPVLARAARAARGTPGPGRPVPRASTSARTRTGAWRSSSNRRIHPIARSFT